MDEWDIEWMDRSVMPFFEESTEGDGIINKKKKRKVPLFLDLTDTEIKPD